jgi:hypothetical protein
MIKEYRKYIEALKEIRKPFSKGLSNYYIVYDEMSGQLFIDQDKYLHRQGTSYLGNSYKEAKSFMQQWSECILKYEFGINNNNLGGLVDEQGVSRSC